MTRARFIVALLTLAAAAPSAPAAGAERVTVAVLYFDNNSPQRDYDVLQKGLADMLVTDLSQVESLQVVERDKLQKLVDELKLQRSRFFDPKTAQRLGQGIGARYAVTGALAAVDPRLRIDVRVIEVATARVVVADKVVGDREKLFELEAELVKKLAQALQARLPGAAPRSGVGDLGTLLRYSQGLDAADKGDLQDASKRLAEVVRSAPDFALAKARYTDVLRRLREAGKRREGALSAAERDLVARIDAALAGARPKDREGWARFLGYRVARGNYHLWKLSALVAPHQSFHGPAIAPAEKRDQVVARARAYFDNTVALVDELRVVRATTGTDVTPGLEPADQKLAEAAGMKDIDKWSFVSPTTAALGLATFIVQGEAPYWGPVRLVYRPSLSDLDRAFGPKALALIAAATQELKKAVAQREEKPDALIDAVDAHGELLVGLGRKEEAIAQWQWVLDTYPTATKYKDLERKIEDLLGLSAEATQFSAAVKACNNELWSLMPGAMSRARRSDGMRGVRKQVEQVGVACRGTAMTPAFMASAWQFAVQEALKAGDCGFYRELRAEAQKLGGNVVDGLVRTAGNACGEVLPELNR